MGGDHAPNVVIDGVKLLHEEVSSDLYLLGDESVLKPLVRKLRRGPRIEIVHCSETIAMGESPMKAVRSKKDSSIVRGLKLAAEDGDNYAFFSAGHSGAVFAAALTEMGRIKGVERPAIATSLPTVRGHCILLDAGANVDARPNHLAEWALMGSAYARVYLKRPSPTVGLLSNGEEESKGTELTRAANALLHDDKRLNYIGYVEGKDIFRKEIDVVVTDGFTGNIVLKSLEGLGTTITSILKAELGRGLINKVGAAFAMPALRKVKKRVDYAEVGSAPLLGVDGNCFIGHGRSGPKAIKNGIIRAQEAIELGLHKSLRESFQEAEAQAESVPPV